MVSSSENDNRHICASVISGVPSTIVNPQLPSEGSPSPSTTDFGMTVTAAPVSTFASIVSFCPVDGFSRLIYTYTCSYGALNFNRSMVSVFGSTSYNFWFGKTFWPSCIEVYVSKVRNNCFLFHHCIYIRFNVREYLFFFSSPPGSRTPTDLLLLVRATNPPGRSLSEDYSTLMTFT